MGWNDWSSVGLGLGGRMLSLHGSGGELRQKESGKNRIRFDISRSKSSCPEEFVMKLRSMTIELEMGDSRLAIRDWSNQEQPI